MSTRTAIYLSILVVAFLSCAPAAQQATPTLTSGTPGPGVTPTPTSTPSGQRPTPLPTATPSTAPTPSARSLYGGKITTYIRADFPGWDPHFSAAAATQQRQAQNIILGQLARERWPDKGCVYGDVEPEVAESWSWTNDTTLTVKLRQGVKFHNKPPVNGRELVADDIIYSFKRLGEGMARSFVHMKEVTAMEALDRYTVQFRFRRPYPAFIPEAMASPWGSVILAKEAADTEGKFFKVEQQIGTGPFQLTRWVQGAKFTYEKFPGYFKEGVPYVDQVVYLDMPDWSTRAAAFRSGVLDFAIEAPTVIAGDLARSAPKAQMIKCASAGGLGEILMRLDKPPFNDVRVRRALVMAVDQDAIIKSAMLGEGLPSAAVHPMLPLALKREDFPPEVRQYVQYNPAEARRLLNEAGYPNGLEVEFWLSRVHGSPFNEIYEALGPMWEAAGFKVKYKWMPYPEHTASMSGKFTDLGGTRGGYRTIYETYPRFHSASPVAWNRGYVKDPALDKLIDQLMAETNPDKQAELARDIQIRIVDQAYWLRLPNEIQYTVIQPWVRNFNGMANSNTVKPLFERVQIQR